MQGLFDKNVYYTYSDSRPQSTNTRFSLTNRYMILRCRDDAYRIHLHATTLEKSPYTNGKLNRKIDALFIGVGFCEHKIISDGGTELDNIFDVL